MSLRVPPTWLKQTGTVVGIDGSDGSIEWSYESTGSSVWGLMQLDDITGIANRISQQVISSGKVAFSMPPREVKFMI